MNTSFFTIQFCTNQPIINGSCRIINNIIFSLLNSLAKTFALKFFFLEIQLFLVLIVSSPASAQQNKDSAFRQTSIQNLIRLYHSGIGHQAHLYNGPLYPPYDRPFTEGHQYFLNDSFNTGDVFYDGLLYTGQPLKYDVIRDELVLLHYNQAYPINLLKEKVAWFSFAGHFFIKITADTSLNFPGDGFYDQLFVSKEIQFLAKRRKLIQEMSSRATIETRPYNRVSYFIVKDGKYHTLRNKKTLMNLMRDKKNEVQEFIKRNGLRFKTSFEEDVRKTVQFYAN